MVVGGSLLVFVVVVEVMAFGLCGSIRRHWVELVVVRRRRRRRGGVLRPLRLCVVF
jgi:hypothetical protein